MPKLTLVYISLSGNTQSFVKRLSEQLSTWHNCQVSTINIKEQNHQTFPVDQPFVALLPTYLEEEMALTMAIKKFLPFHLVIL